ncbi:prolyl oligopeptidase family serine peptidase [Lacimicrobium alkaliphilum]|nr:prolyl oligopeptidase family serine peptidase [Lacimicrobium alkaliphilum]
MKSVLLLAMLLCLCTSVHAGDSFGFEAKTYSHGGQSLNYRILYPADFEPQKTYPLVLFLHGAGERGDDNLAQLTHGAELFAREDVRREYPAIVVFPQAPENDYWANVDVLRESQPYQLQFADISAQPTDAMQLVLALTDVLSAEPFVDKQRVYVGGLSMGAMGTYEILARRPHLFAAAIAICGGGNVNNAAHYQKELHIWAFHGTEDKVVDASLSEEMVAAINQHGGNARLTLYKDTNHNSWDKAFAEPALLPWLFTQRLDE